MTVVLSFWMRKTKEVQSLLSIWCNSVSKSPSGPAAEGSKEGRGDSEA